MDIFKKIEEAEFNDLNIPILFDIKELARCYGVLKLNNSSFKFSWNSDTIDPIVSLVSHCTYSVGIDQHFAVVDFEKNTIMLNLDLSYSFYDTKIFHNWLFVITELEIVQIDKLNFKIVEKYQLPDFFESIEFNNKNIKIQYTGDGTVTVQL